MAQRKKVLLTEDDRFTRFMMREIFDTLGYEADIVDNGQACCDLLNKNPSAYGVVLMDIHMPDMSGVDATSLIRGQTDDPPKNVPIFAITADDDFHNEKYARQHGMNGFIKKPVSPGEINELVERFCP